MDDGEVAHNGEHPQHGGHAIEQRSDDHQHDPFGPLGKANFALRNAVFSAGPGIADHHRTGHHDGGEDDVEEAVDGGVVIEQAHQQAEIGIAIEDRIEEAAETGNLIGFAGDTAVDHVENSGAKDDQAGLKELPLRQKHGGDDVDQQADKGEYIRVDLRESQATDNQQDYLITSPPNCFRERHVNTTLLQPFILRHLVNGGQFDYFEQFRPARDGNGHFVAHLLVKQALSDRRTGGD